MSSPVSTDITIIIVNYNVKEFLVNCLQSVQKAAEHFEAEIFVVDNASTDGSIPFLRDRFKDVQFIENKKNLGFGKANNQAIRRANGKYTLLLNPDTLVQENTLDVLYQKMEANTEWGACGCKILNPDGTFAPESRRSVPKVSTAIYKAIGLTSLFPESKHFGAYYQGWKDEDEEDEVPVLSGSFMYFRTQCLKEVNGFDERFFMYGEDIDLCYRVKEAGWKIYYVPKTSIIHYKGESSKKNEIAYNKAFNDAIYKFFDKHYTSKYSRLFKFLVYWAIRFRAIISFISHNLKDFRFTIADLTVINLALFAGMFIRSSFDPDGWFSIFQPRFLWLNVLWSGLYLIFAQTFGVIKEHKLSIVGSLKAVFFSFLMLVAITFFLRNLAFSRIILATSFLIAFVWIGLMRFRRVNRIKSTRFSRGKVSPVRLLLVGVGESTGEIVNRMKGKAGWQVEIAGVVGQENISDSLIRQPGADYAGEINQLRSLIRTLQVDIVVFLMESVSHKELLSSIRELRDVDVEIKVIPDQMNFLLGKADIEYLDDLAVVNLKLTYFNPVQRIVKRTTETVIGIFGAVFLLPLMIVSIFKKEKAKNTVSVFDGNRNRSLTLFPHDSFSNRMMNRLTICYHLIRGRISIVGAPPYIGEQKETKRYKTGLTGYAQINRERIRNQKDREQFDLHYLQNYSIWLDLDILLKAMIREDSIIGSFIEQSNRGSK
ncbi:MAG: glycosyltransferase [Balneolaceae bacterium]